MADAGCGDYPKARLRRRRLSEPNQSNRESVLNQMAQTEAFECLRSDFETTDRWGEAPRLGPRHSLADLPDFGDTETGV